MLVGRSLIWTSIGQIILFVSQIGSQIVVSRLLPPYIVGIAAIAFSITDFINLMQTFGLRNFLIREMDLSVDKIKTVTTINFILSLVTSVLVFGIAYLAAESYHEPRVGYVLHVTALIPLVLSFELVPGSLLQRNMQFGHLALASSTKALITAGTTVTLVLLGMSYMSIGYGALAGASASAMLTCWIGRRNMHWGFSLRDWRRISIFGLHMFGITGVSTASVRAGELIIGNMLGLADLALYSRASALNNLLWTNIHSVFTRVVFSSMAEERRNTGSIRAIYLKTVDVVTATLWPAFAGLAVFSGPVIHLMYGEKWVAATPVLSLFALAAIGLTAITMTWEVFVVCEKTGEQTRLETARSLLTLAITVLGTMFGIVGAAFGRVGDAVISNLIYRKSLARYTEAPWVEIQAIYRRSALLTLIAVLPGLLVMTANGWDPRTDLVWVLAATAFGFGGWMLTVRLVNCSLYREIWTVFGVIFRKLNGARFCSAGPTVADKTCQNNPAQRETKRALKVIGEAWALDKLGYGYMKIDSFLARAYVHIPEPLRHNEWLKAATLALFSHRFDVLAIMHSALLSKRLLILFGLLGIHKLVLFETIIRNVAEGRTLRIRMLGWLLRRSCRELHVMVAEDVAMYHRAFDFPIERIAFVPWPMITGDNYSGADPLPLVERRIVLSSGRANCDWETLLAAAHDQHWPLVIVCSENDLSRIRDNPLSKGVNILTEISHSEHESLVKSARLYVLCLKQSNISSGQIRLSHCSEFLTPVVASDVYGLRGYLEDGVTGLAVPPEDPASLREVVNRLLGDEAQLAKIAARSAASAEGKTVVRYAETLAGLVR